MGNITSKYVYSGIKILLSELISQTDELNFDLIINMLYNGHMHSNYYDENFHRIFGKCAYDYKNYNGGISRFKEDLELKLNKFNDEILNEYLLLPIKYIASSSDFMSSEHYTPHEINFDLLIDIEKYKEIKNIDIIFITTDKDYNEKNIERESFYEYRFDYDDYDV